MRDGNILKLLECENQLIYNDDIWYLMKILLAISVCNCNIQIILFLPGIKTSELQIVLDLLQMCFMVSVCSTGRFSYHLLLPFIGLMYANFQYRVNREKPRVSSQ